MRFDDSILRTEFVVFHLIKLISNKNLPCKNCFLLTIQQNQEKKLFQNCFLYLIRCVIEKNLSSHC